MSWMPTNGIRLDPTELKGAMVSPNALSRFLTLFHGNRSKELWKFHKMTLVNRLMEKLCCKSACYTNFKLRSWDFNKEKNWHWHKYDLHMTCQWFVCDLHMTCMWLLGWPNNIRWISNMRYLHGTRHVHGH